MGSLVRGAGFGAAVFSLLAVTPKASRADGSDTVVAEALFRDGKDLLAQKDYARACPKFAESFHRDPATGTLLALAMCHERDGKLASAWSEYADVAARSKAESRPDRVKAARAKASELDAKVSRITIQLGDGARNVSGLEIKRNGIAVDSAIWGTALPSDGGVHSIEASAPGRISWHQEVVLGISGDRQTTVIPVLEPAGSAAQPKTVRISLAKARPVEPRMPAVLTPESAEAADRDVAPKVLAPASEPPSGLTAFQHVGIVTGIAGVVGLGFGGYFTYRALAKNDDSGDGCTADFCTAAAKENRLDARSLGDRATISFIGGGILTAAGFTMYLLGRRAPASTSATLRATWAASDGGMGGVLQGTF